MSNPGAAAPLIEYLDAAGTRADASPDCSAGSGHSTSGCRFARVRNLHFVYSPHETYALAPVPPIPLAHAAAFVVDMDGTSTTTEPLALHALEFMVRRLLRSPATGWKGLDPQRDHPFIIGNSNFRHVEFLLSRYADSIDAGKLAAAHAEAVAWTLTHMSDAQRRRDIMRSARNCGLDALVEAALRGACPPGGNEIGCVEKAGAAQAELMRFARTSAGWQPRSESARIGAALDVYYHRYHDILLQVQRGQGDALVQELLGSAGPRLIAPMPGYDVFIALVKGWLGEEAEALHEELAGCMRADDASSALEPAIARRRLSALGRAFERNPARLALVTASITFESHIVMDEVLRQAAARAQAWPISARRKEAIRSRLAAGRSLFDGFVDASDSHEARLKPHPDLYSLALYQMSIAREQFEQVIGLEDTEPGVVALRAAGVGCAIALPNHDTTRQDYRAAARVVRGGLPELMLRHGLMLSAGTEGWKNERKACAGQPDS